MIVTCKLRGLIASELGFMQKEVVLPDGSTTGFLLDELGVEDEVSYTVGGVWRDSEYVLHDGDVLWLYAQTMIPGG